MFTYDNLVNAIGDAIDKQAAEFDGKFVTDKPTEAHKPEPELDFDALMKEFNTIVQQIQSAAGGGFGTTWAPRIIEITERHLGKGKKVSEMNRSQVEQLVLIVDDLKEAVANGI